MSNLPVGKVSTGAENGFKFTKTNISYFFQFSQMSYLSPRFPRELKTIPSRPIFQTNFVNFRRDSSKYVRMKQIKRNK